MNVVLTGLDDSPLIAGLSVTEVNTLESTLIPKKVDAGKTVFLENMHGESLYLIQQGTIRISKMMAEGDEEILVVLGPADVFGEMAIFEETQRSATARVAEDAVLFSLSKKDFEALSVENPALCLKLSVNIIRLFNERIRASHSLHREMLLCALNRRD